VEDYSICLLQGYWVSCTNLQNNVNEKYDKINLKKSVYLQGFVRHRMSCQGD